MKELPVRKNIRLKGYDYSQAGYYFVTICVKDKQKLLGRIVVGAAICRPQTEAICRPQTEATSHPQTEATSHPQTEATSRPQTELSDIGCIVDEAIRNIPRKYNGVSVDKYVIMPNHVHMIVMIAHESGRQIAAPTIQTIIGHMKRAVSMQCGFSPWQKSFHDHIIRSKADYRRIWQYIEENPMKWQGDSYFVK